MIRWQATHTGSGPAGGAALAAAAADPLQLQVGIVAVKKCGISTVLHRVKYSSQSKSTCRHLHNEKCMNYNQSYKALESKYHDAPTTSGPLYFPFLLHGGPHMGHTHTYTCSCMQTIRLFCTLIFLSTNVLDNYVCTHRRASTCNARMRYMQTSAHKNVQAAELWAVGRLQETEDRVKQTLAQRASSRAARWECSTAETRSRCACVGWVGLCVCAMLIAKVLNQCTGACGLVYVKPLHLRPPFRQGKMTGTEEGCNARPWLMVL
jgi:hypothetical protein